MECHYLKLTYTLYAYLDWPTCFLRAGFRAAGQSDHVGTSSEVQEEDVPASKAQDEHDLEA